MLMILARLVRSESFWAVAKVRSPHTGPEFGYPRRGAAGGRGARGLAPLAVDLEDVHSPTAVPPPAALLKVAAVEGEPAGQLLARGDGAVPQLDLPEGSEM